MFDRCLISLHPLRRLTDSLAGVCKKDSEAVFGKGNLITRLTFTRREFISDKPAAQKGMSISGAQPKLSLKISEDRELFVTSDNGEYILKPSPEVYPKLAENEHAIMLCMKKLGFQVPPFGLIPFAEAGDDEIELAFIIKRYDRDNGVKIHQEQLDGAMGIEDKYGNNNGIQSVSYERAAKFLLSATGGSLADKYDIFNRIICTYLVGNNDMHLRNLSIVTLEDGTKKIAPVYDFVSVVPYSSSFTEQLALPLLEKEESHHVVADGLNSPVGEYTGYDFLELADGIGLSRQLAKKQIRKITNNLGSLFDIINISYMLDKDKIMVCDYMAKASKHLNIFDLTHLE